MKTADTTHAFFRHSPFPVRIIPMNADLAREALPNPKSLIKNRGGSFAIWERESPS